MWPFNKFARPESKPHILSFETYDDWDRIPMQDQFVVHQFPASAKPADMPAELLQKIRAFAFKGSTVLSADIMDAFPNLELIASYGVSIDTIDIAHATAKGISVTNTPDVLIDDVADLAVGMLLSLTRDIRSCAYPLQKSLFGASVGIVGLGRTGHAIATRLEGFNTQVHYFSRFEKDTLGWTYHYDLKDLAHTVDILIVALPDGPETAGLISADIIKALGPDGILIDSTRGASVDMDALLHALEKKELCGAALEVSSNTPDPEPRFQHLDNMLLQVHKAPGIVETRKRMGELQRRNLNAFFANEPLLTVVS